MGGGGGMQMPWDMPREMGAGFPGGPPIGSPSFDVQMPVMQPYERAQQEQFGGPPMMGGLGFGPSLMGPGLPSTAYESPFAGGEYGSRGYFAEGGQIRPFEGLIAGNGGGMDDSVVASIEGNEPILVSRDEYVVPADVVSALGDGSSRHGAQLLDGMNSQVRLAKNGSPEQPRRLNVSPLDLLRRGG